MAASAASHCMIYVTASSMGEAEAIGRALVNEKQAACANILCEARSIYRWKGKIEEANEAVLIAKTRNGLIARAMERISELHSNDVPCAVAYKMETGLPQYLNWIDAETAG